MIRTSHRENFLNFLFSRGAKGFEQFVYYFIYRPPVGSEENFLACVEIF